MPLAVGIYVFYQDYNAMGLRVTNITNAIAVPNFSSSIDTTCLLPRENDPLYYILVQAGRGLETLRIANNDGSKLQSIIFRGTNLKRLYIELDTPRLLTFDLKYRDRLQDVATAPIIEKQCLFSMETDRAKTQLDELLLDIDCKNLAIRELIIPFSRVITLGTRFFRGTRVQVVDFTRATEWVDGSVITSLLTNSTDRKARGLEPLTLKLSQATYDVLTQEQREAIEGKGYVIQVG